MPVAENLAKRRLRDGALVLGLGVRLARTVEIGMIARAAGFDFLFIDREHSALEMSTAAEICVAALGQGITPLVRVPGSEPFHSIPLLDNGAQGVALPHVENAEEARAIVDALCFPPKGHRSISRNAASVGFSPIPIAEFTEQGNRELLVVAMLESPAAIEACEQIAAVDGIDVLLIGTSDLCAEMGIHGAFGDPRIVAAYERVIAACARNGKVAGVSGVRERELMRRYIGMGARFVVAVTDLPLLIEAGKQRTEELRRE